MVNARSKGKRGELTICGLFRSWWGGEWSRNKVGYAIDDVCTPADFPCSLEVKNQKGVALRNFWQPTKLIDGWWEQCKQQATKVGKLPMLCVNCDRDWYAILIMRDYMAIGWELPAVYMAVQWNATDLVIITRLSHLMTFNPKVVADE